jgi:EAL domain-containing protein (putative c-di-GMP-specific phosphodiesterase class I)
MTVMSLEMLASTEVASARRRPSVAGLAVADPAASFTDAAFSRALRSLSLVYQPIVRWSARCVVAHEALVRTAEPGLETPFALFANRKPEERRGLGRAIRERLAADLGSIDGDVFANLDAGDLLDAELYDRAAPLSAFSDRVVLEITERAALDEVPDIRYRVAKLRNMGFRIAVDDIGAGYSGLTSLAVLEPEVVKLDMSLVRHVDREPTRRHVIRSLAKLCAKLRSMVVAEGVETRRERDALVAAGCDTFQGYLFARPARWPPTVAW